MEGVGSLMQTLRGFRVLEDASRFEEEMRSLKRRGPAMRRKQKKRRRKRRRALRQTESHNILGRRKERGGSVSVPHGRSKQKSKRQNAAKSSTRHLLPAESMQILQGFLRRVPACQERISTACSAHANPAPTQLAFLRTMIVRAATAVRACCARTEVSGQYGGLCSEQLRPGMQL